MPESWKCYCGCVVISVVNMPAMEKTSENEIWMVPFCCNCSYFHMNGAHGDSHSGSWSTGTFFKNTILTLCLLVCSDTAHDVVHFSEGKKILSTFFILFFWSLKCHLCWSNNRVKAWDVHSCGDSCSERWFFLIFFTGTIIFTLIHLFFSPSNYSYWFFFC